MKKVKQPWSRKKRALLRLVFIVPLLVLLVLSCRYGFTEEHAIWEHEEILGLGPTQIIRNVGELPFGEIEHENITLSGNKNALLMSMQLFDWKNGWQSAGRTGLDCTTGNDVMWAYWQIDENKMEPGPQIYYFFGEVADDSIQSLAVQLRVGKQEKLVWEQEITGKDWIEWNGRRLFLMLWQPEEPRKDTDWWTFDIRSVDENGKETRHSHQNWTHSSVPTAKFTAKFG